MESLSFLSFRHILMCDLVVFIARKRHERHWHFTQFSLKMIELHFVFDKPPLFQVSKFMI